MATCEVCGEEVTMPYRCKFCGQLFCDEHRLPENHECPGLERYKDARTNVRRAFASGRPSEGPSDTHILYTVERVRREGATPPVFEVANRALVPKLVAICAVVYVLQSLVPGFTESLMLYPDELAARPWTILTHVFLHAGFAHVFFNMWVLYIFGSRLEEDIGSETFLAVFLLAGVLGGLAYVALEPASGTPALGASGAIYGVFGCLAILRPNLTVLIQFLIPMRLIHAAFLYAAIDLMYLPVQDSIGHAAHLAGIVVGFAAGRYLQEHGVR